MLFLVSELITTLGGKPNWFLMKENNPTSKGFEGPAMAGARRALQRV